MAESSPARASRSRSRSPSDPTITQARSSHHEEHSVESADDDHEQGEIRVSIRNSPAVDRSPDNRIGKAKRETIKSDAKSTTHLAAQPKPNSQRKSDTRDAVSNSHAHEPREPTRPSRVEPAHSDPHRSDPLRHPRTDTYIARPASPGRASNNNHRSDLSHSRGSIRDLDDDRGRKPYPPAKHKSKSAPQHPHTNEVTHTIYNRVDHVSVDVHQWQAHGNDYHSFWYYRGPPTTGYRRPENRIGAESHAIYGRFANPYDDLGSGRGSDKPTRKRSPERVEPPEYERPTKRQRGLDDSDGYLPSSARGYSQPSLNPNDLRGVGDALAQLVPLLQFAGGARTSYEAMDRNGAAARGTNNYRR